MHRVQRFYPFPFTKFHFAPPPASRIWFALPPPGICPPPPPPKIHVIALNDSYCCNNSLVIWMSHQFWQNNLTVMQSIFVFANARRVDIWILPVCLKRCLCQNEFNNWQPAYLVILLSWITEDFYYLDVPLVFLYAVNLILLCYII